MSFYVIKSNNGKYKAAANYLILFLFFFLFICLSEIIDDLSHLVDKTDDRIRNETRRVNLVETKSASCGKPFSFPVLSSYCTVLV